MTVSVQGRTSWLSKPPMQSRRSAASGCTNATAQWVWQSIDSNSLLHLIQPVTKSSFWNYFSEQEQAQSICKVLSASFDCALTSDKSWGQRDGWELRWKREVTQLQKNSSSESGDKHGCIIISENLQSFSFLFFFSSFAFFLREINWNTKTCVFFHVN